MLFIDKKNYTRPRSVWNNRKQVVVNIFRSTFQSNILDQFSARLLSCTQPSIDKSTIGYFSRSIWFVGCKGSDDDSFQVDICCDRWNC